MFVFHLSVRRNRSCLKSSNIGKILDKVCSYKEEQAYKNWQDENLVWFGNKIDAYYSHRQTLRQN